MMVNSEEGPKVETAPQQTRLYFATMMELQKITRYMCSS